VGWIYRPKALIKGPDGHPLLDPQGKKQYRFTTENLTIGYYDINGVRHDEATHSPKRSIATTLLRQREGAKGSGTLPTLPEKITFEQGVELYHFNFLQKKRKGWSHTFGRITNHLAPVFGGRYLSTITHTDLVAYNLTRLEAGASGPTITRELAALRRILTLAAKAGRLTTVRPDFTEVMHQRATPRQGFFEWDLFVRVREHFPPALRGLLTVAYLTGWRIKSEVHPLTFDCLSLDAGELRLAPEMTKNGRGRVFPLDAIPELRQVLQAQVASAERVQRQTGRIVRAIFHNPDGRKRGTRIGIHTFYAAWHRAVQAVGLPARIPHDFRRSAVRNLAAANVPRDTAKKMTGHLTDAIFTDYNIVIDHDLRWGAELLQAHLTRVQARATGARKPPKVRSITGGR
jgi:integrase